MLHTAEYINHELNVTIAFSVTQSSLDSVDTFQELAFGTRERLRHGRYISS